MAFTVQTDDGLTAGANAYVSVEEFKAYHDDRGNSYGVVTDQQIQQAVVRATDYVDSRFRYDGRKLQGPSQSTQFPRLSLYDADGSLVSGVPDVVREACAEYALVSLTGALDPNPTTDSSGQVLKALSEKVGPVEESKEFAAGGTVQRPRYPVADARLRASGFVLSGGYVLRG